MRNVSGLSQRQFCLVFQTPDCGITHLLSSILPGGVIPNQIFFTLSSFYCL